MNFNAEWQQDSLFEFVYASWEAALAPRVCKQISSFMYFYIILFFLATHELVMLPFYFIIAFKSSPLNAMTISYGTGVE